MAETFGIDYYSIQIAVAIIFAIIGSTVYTIYRFNQKKETIEDVNKTLQAYDVALEIQQIVFNNKFWKTAGFAMAASVAIILLSYTQVVETIVPGEHIMITAAKAAALGATLNFVINWAAGGGKLNSVITTVLQALLSMNQAPPEQKLQVAKKVIEANKLKVSLKAQPKQTTSLELKDNQNNT